MKIKIKKAELDKEPAHIQALCKEIAGEAGVFELDTETIEDVGTLKKAHETGKQSEKAAKKEASDLKKQLEDMTAELTTFQELAGKTVPKENLDALQKSFDAKLAKITGEHGEKVKSLEGALGKHLVGGTASRLAAEISTAPDLILPHITSRLAFEVDGTGEAVLKVLGGDGKPSVLTVDDLKKEFVANKSFSAIIKAGSASGGGATGAKDGGGATSKQTYDFSKPFDPKAYAESMTARGLIPAKE